MSDKPVLPILPPVHWHECSPTNAAHISYFEEYQMRAYGRSCYQAGYRKALEDAAKAVSLGTVSATDPPALTHNDAIADAICAIQALGGAALLGEPE